jgi:hypothetical protein
MSLQIRLMGDKVEAETVWEDLESALEEQGYTVSLDGMKKNQGDSGYRFYGEIQ